METDKSPAQSSKKKYYIDPTFIYPPREGVEMVTPLRNGLGKLQHLIHTVEMGEHKKWKFFPFVFCALLMKIGHFYQPGASHPAGIGMFSASVCMYIHKNHMQLVTS